MLGVVHAVLLDLEGDADSDGHLAQLEEDSGKHPDPANDGKDENNVGGKHVTGSPVENSGALSGTGRVVGGSVLITGGEEPRGDDTPDTAESVDGDSADNVVDLEVLKGSNSGEVEEGSNDSNDEGTLELNGGASGSDGDESGEDSVVGSTYVDDLVLGHKSSEGNGGKAAGRGGDGGGNHGVGGGVGEVSSGGSEGKGGGSVESVPSHPEDKSTEGLEDDRLLGELDSLIEAANTGSDGGGSGEGGDGTGQVDNSGSSEVGDSASEEEVVLTPSGSPAVGVPSPVDDNGVDEGSEDDRVDDVASEGDALGDGSGDDGGGSGGKGPLEKPGGLDGVVNILHEEVLLSDEGREVGGVLGGTESDGVPEEPPAEGSEGSIKDILDKDILRVLNVDHADLEHAAERVTMVVGKVGRGGRGVRGAAGGELSEKIFPKFSGR